ncbi:MAG TPA: glycine zipper 2TM domain-containing protein [Thiobacillaceae bacterium]|nr:glycine zipper 2TM domain-containing protein [Thiobacillaceae bacterium]HNU63783.1 glycine zipper 2TM domain-containing protein [Thiobacillaceae bacterium]
MNERLAVLLVPILLVGLLSGCASGLGSSDYERGEARRAYEVKTGVVESVRQVRLEGTDSKVGTVAGGAVGGVAGSSVGSGKGSVIGAVLGAVAGGLAGAAAEEGLTRKTGLEIVVRLDTIPFRTISVVQEDTGESFARGDRVRVLESGGQTRVTRQ